MGVTTKLAYIKGSFLCILGSFIKGKVQNWGYLRRLLKFQTFFGVLENLDIFWGRTVDAGPEPTYTEKIRVGLPPGDVVSNN